MRTCRMTWPTPRAAGLNVSAVVQSALRRELAATSFQAWYRGLRAAVPAASVFSDAVGTALRAVRDDEFGA